MARNDANGNCTEHIDLEYHFVRDSLKEDKIVPEYCLTTEMKADILTDSELLPKVLK